MTTFVSSQASVSQTTTATGGATIIPVHVAMPIPGGRPADLAALALSKLGTFLTNEGPGLARVLHLLDLPGAEADLQALRALLVAPKGTRQALVEAERLLDRLVEALAEVSARAEIQRLIPQVDQSLAREIDAAIRWFGARTQDMLELVRHVLS